VHNAKDGYLELLPPFFLGHRSVVSKDLSRSDRCSLAYVNKDLLVFLSVVSDAHL